MNKKITISPELFSSKKNSKSSSQPKTTIHKHIVKEMNKHKNQQIKHENKQSTKDDFSYLSNLSNLRKKSKKNRQSLQPNSISDTSTIKQAPPYGILKNSGTPTWREYHNKTLKQPIKQNNAPTITILPTQPTTTQPTILPPTQPTILPPTQPTVNKEVKKKPKTYKLGKFKNKVSVLIKNKKTRKRIINDKKILEQASLKEIKEYLKKRNLYKSGSAAPSYILKQTYIHSNLSGDVKNLSDKTLLHNYISA
tara:strand:- start:127 stop:882 length:756 start_codon:yes stop_codon:yes gene_type:complete